MGVEFCQERLNCDCECFNYTFFDDSDNNGEVSMTNSCHKLCMSM